MLFVRRFQALSLLVLVASSAVACREKEQPGAALVADAATALAAPEAGATAVDVTTCQGCALATMPSWTFEGIYRDAACTDPLAQIATPACGQIPALGASPVTYVDEVGGRKANETANVTLVEQVAAETPRYRKTAKGCVRANESATHVAPMGCAGARACRDQAGALACNNCRTFANGCPDFEETRLYATINDPAIKGAPAGGGGGSGNVARLKACCGLLAAEAKRLGSSPEAGILNTAAAQCNALAAAAGPSGTAPELGALRTILAGRNLPDACRGF